MDLKDYQFAAVKRWAMSPRSQIHDSDPIIHPELAMIIATARRAHLFSWLPTEVVITQPCQNLVPQAQHYWSLEAKQVRSITGFTEHEWPTRSPNTLGGSSHNYGYLLQLYLDGGDDGHTDYYLSGYVLMEHPEFERLMAHVNDPTVKRYPYYEFVTPDEIAHNTALRLEGVTS